MQKPVAVTFDCYGTLVDWETGISEFLRQLLQEKKARVNVAELVRIREDLDFELVRGGYRSYRQILALSLRDAFSKLGIEYAESDGARLAESVPDWPVFDETRPALERLKRHCRLAIISNIDTDIIEKTKLKIGVPFDLIVTAQQAQAYKPSTVPFELALRRLSAKPQDVLHVSSGFRYDIPPASKMGFRTAWVNRKQESRASDVRSDYEFSNLAELADFLDDK